MLRGIAIALLFCAPLHAITRSAAQKQADALWGPSSWIEERWDHPKVCTPTTMQPIIGPAYTTNVCVINTAKTRHVYTVCRVRFDILTGQELRACWDSSSWSGAFKNAEAVP